MPTEPNPTFLAKLLAAQRAQGESPHFVAKPGGVPGDAGGRIVVSGPHITPVAGPHITHLGEPTIVPTAPASPGVGAPDLSKTDFGGPESGAGLTPAQLRGFKDSLAKLDSMPDRFARETRTPEIPMEEVGEIHISPEHELAEVEPFPADKVILESEPVSGLEGLSPIPVG